MRLYKTFAIMAFAIFLTPANASRSYKYIARHGVWQVGMMCNLYISNIGTNTQTVTVEGKLVELKAASPAQSLFLNPPEPQECGISLSINASGDRAQFTLPPDCTAVLVSTFGVTYNASSICRGTITVQEDMGAILGHATVYQSSPWITVQTIQFNSGRPF